MVSLAKVEVFGFLVVFVKYPSYVWRATTDQLARNPEYSSGPTKLGVPNVMTVSADLSLMWARA